jgi:hypothetical protein
VGHVMLATVDEAAAVAAGSCCPSHPGCGFPVNGRCAPVTRDAEHAPERLLNLAVRVLTVLTGLFLTTNLIAC